MYQQYIIYIFGLKHSPINTNIDSKIAWKSSLANVSNNYLPETPIWRCFPQRIWLSGPDECCLVNCCHYLVLSIGDVRVCIEIYESARGDFTFSIDKFS